VSGAVVKWEPPPVDWAPQVTVIDEDSLHTITFRVRRRIVKVGDQVVSETFGLTSETSEGKPKITIIRLC
jgi:hypothetical protein